MANYTVIDIPFSLRYTCWFCGEPSAVVVDIPPQPSDASQLRHDLLAVPTCAECQGFIGRQGLSSLAQYRQLVKQGLTRKYQKALAIGANWTEQELADSEFDGAAFAGFKRSAWQMHVIAKERLNFAGWPVCVDGIELSSDTGIDTSNDDGYFEFDGTRFVNLDSAIEHYIKAFHLDSQLLPEMLQILGKDKFAYAIRLCRLHPQISSEQRRQILADVVSLQREENMLVLTPSGLGPVRSVPLAQIKELILQRTQIHAVAIQWALEHDMTTVARLVENEVQFYAAFSDVDERVAFNYFNSLLVYLEQRENNQWSLQQDPNQALWQL